MKTKKTTRIRVTRTGRRLVLALALSLGFGLGYCLTACNVTRVVSTESQVFQKGDTSVTITTRTVETYDASKKL